MNAIENNNTPVILSVKETAAILRMGKNTVYALIKEGKLRSLRSGKKIRIPMSAISEYIESNLTA